MPRTEAQIRAQKKYYARPEIKEKINEYSNRKVICECGITSNYSVLQRHKKSKRHSKLLNKKNIPDSLNPTEDT